MNIKAFALGFALVLPFTVMGSAEARQKAPHPLAGELFIDGTTVTAYYVGTKRPDEVRLSAICQTADTSVVWGEAQTLTVSPTVVTYSPPAGLTCRVDLFVVQGGGKIVYLDDPVVLPS